VRPLWAVADWTERPSGFDERVTTSRQLPASWARETKGVHSAQAEVGMDGEGVGSEGGVRPQVGLGIGVVGGSDVAPFGVHDHQ
jgi:hypothetical protein